MGWVVEEVILPVEEVIHFCGGGYTPFGGGYSHSCDFIVSPSPFGLDFGTSDLGLTINRKKYNFSRLLLLLDNLQCQCYICHKKYVFWKGSLSLPWLN